LASQFSIGVSRGELSAGEGKFVDRGFFAWGIFWRGKYNSDHYLDSSECKPLLGKLIYRNFGKWLEVRRKWCQIKMKTALLDSP